MLPRFLLTLMTRMRSSWPLRASRLRTGRMSTWRAGQERAHADVDGEAALDALDDAARDDAALLIGALHVVPDLHLLGFFLGEDDVAFLVLGLLEQHVDRVADLDRDLARLVAELVDGDDPLGLVADVDDDLALATRCSTMPRTTSPSAKFLKLTSYMSRRRSYSSGSIGLSGDGSTGAANGSLGCDGGGFFVLFGLRHVRGGTSRALRICSGATAPRRGSVRHAKNGQG